MRMSLKKLVMGGVAAAVLSTGAVSTANAGEIEANIALSTDYIFRGVSQTGNDPAISGGFDYSFDNGFYAGIWASNVNFGSNAEVGVDENDGVVVVETSTTSTEIDVYAGWAGEISEGVELDLGYIYFVYPGDSGSLNYSEFTAGISFGGLGFGLVYSPDYFGSDEDGIVFNVDYSVGLTKSVSLDLHAGYTTTGEEAFAFPVDSEGQFGPDAFDDYLDWSIGLSTSAAGVDLSLTYYDTDISESNADFGEAAEDRIVFSIGKSF